MTLQPLSGGQATAQAILYAAAFLDSPGNHANGDTVAYFNRQEYLDAFVALPDLLLHLRNAVSLFGGRCRDATEQAWLSDAKDALRRAGVIV